MKSMFRFIAVFLFVTSQALAGVSLEYLAEHFASAKTPTKEHFGEEGKVELACTEYRNDGLRSDFPRELTLSSLGIVHVDKDSHEKYYTPTDRGMMEVHEDNSTKYIGTLRVIDGGIWIYEQSAKMKNRMKASRKDNDWWKSAKPSIIDPSYRVHSYIVCTVKS